MTDVKLVKDCGLYPNYKKIIDFTGTKSQIISKQISWINGFTHRDEFDVNYNKFQNKLVMPIDYEEALTYTYCVLNNITGTGDNPQFFFVNEVENLTNGIDNAEPNVAFYLSLDTIMTYMGDWRIDECMVDREHVDRWQASNAKPIRITPNADNVTAFNNVDAISKISGTINNKDYIIICVAFTSDKLDVISNSSSYVAPDNLYYGVFPVYLDSNDNIYGIFADADLSILGPSNEVGYLGVYPTLSSVIDGTFLNQFKITPEDIVSISILPINTWTLNDAHTNDVITVDYIPGISGYSGSITVPSNLITSVVYWLGNNVPYNADINWVSTSQMWTGNKTRVLLTEDISDIENGRFPTMMQVFIYSDIIDSELSKTINFSVPSKPGIHSVKGYIHEPALYMYPYLKRGIVDGKGQMIMEIPDNIFYANASSMGSLTINIREMLDGSNCSILYYINNVVESGVMGSSVVYPNETLYVVNDAWKTYALTKKDSDRQMTTNYAIKNAIDNLIYMSYGGALVGSRSAGEEGYFGRTPVERTFVRTHDTKTGRFNGGYWDEKGGKLYPTDTGKRVLGAVGLAGAASIVTSLVDAHTAWANQMEKEKMIQNQPAGLLQGASGQSLLNDELALHYAVETKVDDIALNRAFENFFKYGYWVYKFEKPNLQSRKYFNYILTNGAIINGAINQTIRDTIASIFDAGVTIFHYDSGDTKTRNLEYTDYENIEVSLL